MMEDAFKEPAGISVLETTSPTTISPPGVRETTGPGPDNGTPKSVFDRSQYGSPILESESTGRPRLQKSNSSEPGPSMMGSAFSSAFAPPTRVGALSDSANPAKRRLLRGSTERGTPLFGKPPKDRVAMPVVTTPKTGDLSQHTLVPGVRMKVRALFLTGLNGSAPPSHGDVGARVDALGSTSALQFTPSNSARRARASRSWYVPWHSQHRAGPVSPRGPVASSHGLLGRSL
jgi:hypothetical protein